MFDRWTDRARKAMQLANQTAMEYDHKHIDTEHQLVGICKEGGGVAAIVLKNQGVGLANLRRSVENLMTRGPREVITVGKLPMAPRAKKACEYANEEAATLQHNYVGSEHFVLGLLRATEGVASKVLAEFGVVADKFRDDVLALLKGRSKELAAISGYPREMSFANAVKPAYSVEVGAKELVGRTVKAKDADKGDPEKQLPLTGKVVATWLCPITVDDCSYAHLMLVVQTTTGRLMNARVQDCELLEDK